MVDEPIYRKMQKVYCFYKTTNNINGHYYYGKSSLDRIKQGYKGSGQALYKAFRKYGKENFTTEVLATFETEEEAYQYEHDHILLEDLRQSECYNAQEGGKGGHSGTIYMKRGSTQIRVDPVRVDTMKQQGFEVGKIVNPEAAVKSRQTRIKKYGTANGAMITPEAIAKAMKTRAEKHGGNPMAQLQTPEVVAKARERGKQSLTLKYSGDVMGMCHTKEAQKNREEALLVKYGSRTGNLLLPESKEKALKTREKRYGYAAALMNTEEANRKSLETRMVLYERKRKVSQSPEFKAWFAPIRSEYHLPKDAVNRFLQETGKTLEDYS